VQLTLSTLASTASAGAPARKAAANDRSSVGRCASDARWSVAKIAAATPSTIRAAMTSTDGRRTEAPADVGHRHGLPRGDRRGNLALPILLLSIAYVAVHGAVISRFPLFVDESIYARFALTVPA